MRIRQIITERQRELLQFIYENIRDTGYSPSLEEMRQYMDISSNQAVIDLIKGLEKRGLIIRAAQFAKSRNIKITSDGYKIIGETPLIAILGTTSAGLPLEAIEISGEWETMPTSDVAKLKDEVSILKVFGDSMVNAGIEDGDAVLVKNQKEFVSGDIVLAHIGEESTIKRFISQDQPPYVYLKPENPNYKIILFNDETELRGKVISVLKHGYWKPVKS